MSISDILYGISWMFTSILISGAAGFIPLLPIMAFFHMILLLKDKRNHIKTAPLHIAGVSVLFCSHVFFYATSTPIYALRHFQSFRPVFNFLPFADIFTNFPHYVLNMLLFVPVGFLLPVLWKRFEKKHMTFLCGFSLSLFIEITQLFTPSVTNVDDLLMNTAGTIMGYFLFVLLKKCFLEFQNSLLNS